MTSGTTAPEPGPDRPVARSLLSGDGSGSLSRSGVPAFRRHRFTVTGILDYLFFLFGGASSTWLAILILLKRFSLGWWQLLTLLAERRTVRSKTDRALSDRIEPLK